MTAVRFAFMIVAVFLLSTFPSQALTPEEVLDNPIIEERARNLTRGLKCLICQNQSVDESDAEFAVSVRKLVRDRISAGASDDEIIGFLRNRYGDYILLKPPLRPSTIFLWLAPFVLLSAGLIVIVARRSGGKDSA